MNSTMLKLVFYTFETLGPWDMVDTPKKQGPCFKNKTDPMYLNTKQVSLHEGK